MHLKSIYLSSLAVVVMLALSSCASWTPGNRIDSDELKDGISPENIHVELVPITPQLIIQEQKERRPATIPPELLTKEPKLYHIGAGDILFITVWDHPELTVPSGSQQQILSNGRTVHPNGELFYPHVGKIMAMGMTLLELSSKLTEELSRYIESPQVDVSVLSFESQKVLLSGALRNTMPIRITTSPISLVEALGTAGVDTERADLSNVILTRGDHKYVLDVDELTRTSTDLNLLYLQDKDRIHVSYNDQKKVFVMGEVKIPMSLAYRDHSISLSNALSSAGGLDQLTANGNGVYVIRGMDDLGKKPAKVFQLSTDSATGFILASSFQLEPQDVIYVGATRIRYWNRVIYELLPTATLMHETTSLAVDIKDIKNNF